MLFFKLVLIKLIIFNFSFSDNSLQGIVKGQIFDLENQLPLSGANIMIKGCLLYTSPSPRDRH